MEITFIDAKKLLDKYITKSNGEYDEWLYRHSLAVANLCFEVTKKINEKHPELNLDPEFMRVVGILHDIDKHNSNDLHPYYGALLLEKLGYKRIADVVKTHTLMYELAKENNIEGDFLPKTLEQKILVYADSRVKHDKVVLFEERYSDLYERCKNTKRESSIRNSYDLLKSIVDEIDNNYLK